MRRSLTVSSNPNALVRPLVRRLHAYTPGEQPKIPGLIKLNTNENPYPPSPRVRKAIQNAVDGRLRLYPNPTAQLLREKLAALHACRAENIIIGNGSDDLLALATRAFVEPRPGLRGGGAARKSRSRPLSRATVQYFVPSYSLYPVLADIQGAWKNPNPLGDFFALPTRQELASQPRWDSRAALTFVTTPNAPSGRGYSLDQLEELCRQQHGVVVLDEAYVDFAREHALSLALKHPHVLVARTFSKAYSLCFLRVGYMVGHPALIAALDKVRDSYNVNGLGQIGALATLDDLEYYRRNFQRVIQTRERLGAELQKMDFAVFPSETNFILTRPPRWSAQDWASQLRKEKILVRWFDQKIVRSCLRISIGTDEEIDRLLRVVKKILR